MNIDAFHVTDKSWTDPARVPLKKENWSFFMATNCDRAITFFPPDCRTSDLSLLSGSVTVDDRKILTVFDPQVTLNGSTYNMHAEPSKVSYLAKAAGYDVIHVSTDIGVDDLFLLDASIYTPTSVCRLQADGQWSAPAPVPQASSKRQTVSKQTMLACIVMHNECPDALNQIMTSIARQYGTDNLSLGLSLQQLLAGKSIDEPDALGALIPALPIDEKIKNELHVTLTGESLPATLTSPSPPPVLDSQGADHSRRNDNAPTRSPVPKR